MVCWFTVTPTENIFISSVVLQTTSLRDDVLPCIDAIEEWMQVNRVRLNSSNTECWWFATSRLSHHMNTEGFKLPYGKTCFCVHYLGVFDFNMNMRSHVNRLVSNCYYSIWRIRSTRCLIPISMVITLMNSIITAMVDHCNSFLVYLPAYQTDRIQTDLNDAARLCFDGSRRDDVAPVLCNRLHWLCALERIQFKVVLLVYKAINNLVPVTSWATIARVAQTMSIHIGLQTKRSSSSRKLELSSGRNLSHLQNRINYHCVLCL